MPATHPVHINSRQTLATGSNDNFNNFTGTGKGRSNHHRQGGCTSNLSTAIKNLLCHFESDYINDVNTKLLRSRLVKWTRAVTMNVDKKSQGHVISVGLAASV